MFHFIRNYQFSKVLLPLHTLISSVWALQLLYLLSALSIIHLILVNFNFNHSKLLYCGFHFSFSWWLKILNVFSCAYWPFMSFFWTVWLNLLPIFLLSIFYYWFAGAPYVRFQKKYYLSYLWSHSYLLTTKCLRFSFEFSCPTWGTNYTWPLTSMDLNCVGPLIHELFLV